MMTADQQAELRARAHADEGCVEALISRDCAVLAERLSAGRTRSSEREIGYGTILEVIGIDAGNRLIDFIQELPEMRHVRPLLEQGRLRIGSPMVQSTLRAFDSAVLSSADADALCALGVQPDPLTAQQVAEALFNPDGSEK